MQLSPTFIANVQDLYGKEGRDWINDLPSHVNQLAEKWGFHFLQVMPDLTYNFVVLVEIISTGEAAILKIAPVNKSITTEVRWLRSFNEGVPKIYWYDDEHYAFLMERLEPGQSLKTLVRAGDDDSATRIICHTIRNLQSHQQKQFEFTHLSELVGSLTVLKNRLDNKIVSKAESLFRELTVDRTQDVILHGDLHHDNVLSSGTTWKVIDPHGYSGDPAFEVGSVLYNPRDCFPQDRSITQIVERRLHILAEELSFDSQRIKAWAFCKTALSIAWTIEGHATLPELEVNILAAIDQVYI